MRQSDGSTIRDSLTSIARQTGEVPPELEPVECLQEAKYIWRFWLELDRRRRPDEPLCWADIYAWAQLSGTDLDAFELDLLNRIEDLYMKELKRVKKEGQQ